MGNKGNLFLIPTIIAANTLDAVVPPEVKRRLMDIRHFLAEDIRTARRYLGSLKIYPGIESLSFFVLDKNTKEAELDPFFAPVFEGKHLGVLSESGCPGIADPGAIAVRFAHRNGIKVVPMVGPSSVLLSLMASGLNGQQFAFQGYLPIQTGPAAKTIRELEKESRSKNQTQIFIETPYRNNALLANLLKHLTPETSLCIAVDVTGENEFILTQSVKKWRGKVPTLPKNPAVFLFLA
jgi:16S rRNA (cytidine1402-2'-O)-methyltransferase